MNVYMSSALIITVLLVPYCPVCYMNFMMSVFDEYIEGVGHIVEGIHQAGLLTFPANTSSKDTTDIQPGNCQAAVEMQLGSRQEAREMLGVSQGVIDTHPRANQKPGSTKQESKAAKQKPEADKQKKHPENQKEIVFLVFVLYVRNNK